jgi:ribose/xylose/arabinose/galactoside ABC-type transport system permease subunit
VIAEGRPHGRPSDAKIDARRTIQTVEGEAMGSSSEATAAATPPPRVPLAERLTRAGSTVARLGGLTLAVIVIAGIFDVRTHGQMIQVDNVLGIIRAVSTIAIMSLGLLLVIVAGEIDLSFANLYGLCTNVLAVLWLLHGVPVYLAILAAIAVAVLVGCFNAFFTSVVGIPSFIATLGSSTLVFGFTLYIGKTQNYSAQFPPEGRTVPASQYDFFHGLSNLHLPRNFPMQGLWTLGLLLVFGFLLGRSLFGFRLKAIGGNRTAARLARLPVRRYTFIAFVLCSVMACIAGILDFAFIGSAGPNDGQSNLFPVFAAVIIGGASLSGGKGTVIGTLTGALLLAVLNNGLALEASGPFAQQTLLGTVTIAAVVLDRYTNRARRAA